ncbi:MAG: lipopolysaccharide biosynthesis protein [Bacillota bacterium]|nr:lipopolysaccharide biosynthesis protein [Bacillota bacterium]
MDKGKMAKDTFLFLPAKIIEGVIVMLTTALYTKLFITEAYGSFQIINTTMLVAYLICASWLTNSATRYIGDELKKDSGRAFYSTIISSYLAISAAVCAICLVLYLAGSNSSWPAGALMFAAYTLFMMLNAMLVQAGLIKWSIILSLTDVSVKLAAAYFFAGMLPSGAGTPYPAVFASASGDFIASVGALFALNIPYLYKPSRFSKSLFSGLMRFGFPLIGVSVSVGLLNMVDRYIVVLSMGKAPFAVYSANYAISSGVFTMLMVGVMRGVYPAVLSAWRDGGREKAVPYLDAGVRLYALIALPSAAGLVAVGSLLSRILFARPEYHAGAPVIGITACAMFFMGLTEYANKAYELTKNTVPVLQNAAFSAVIKVASSFLLLPLFGISGAAFGTFLAFLFYFVLTALRAKKLFIFHMSARRKLNIFISSALCALAAYSASMLPVHPAVALILAVFAGFFVYASSIVLSGEVKNELDFIMKRLKIKKI